MKILRVLPVFLIALIWACSGSGDDDSPQKPQINVELPSSGVVHVDEQGGGMVKFTSNTDWSVSTSDTRNSAWLSIAPKSGKPGTVQLKLTAQPNTQAKERRSGVTIEAGGATKRFEVSQPAAEETISLDMPSVSVDAAAVSVELNVTTNGAEWRVENVPAWLAVTPESGTESAKVRLSFTENKGAERPATILFTTGKASQSLSVMQKGVEKPDPVLTLSKTSEKVSDVAGSFLLEVTTEGVPWNVVESSGWLSVAPSTGTGNTRTSVNYAANPDAKERTGTVKFVSGELSVTLTVTQDAAATEITLTPATQQVEAKAGSFSLSVATKGTHWTSSVPPAWVRLSETYGEGSKTIAISYDENTICTERSCNIVFTTQSVSKTLTITQEAAAATLSLDITAKKVGNSAGSFDMNVTTNEAEWRVVGGNKDWVSVAPTQGVGKTKVRISYSQNTGEEARTETVIFKSGEETKTLRVTQDPADKPLPKITVTPTSITVPASEGDFLVNILSNMKWSPYRIPDWISVMSDDTEPSAIPMPVKVKYQANPRTLKRVATIGFQIDGASAYLTVEQDAKAVEIVVSPSDLTFEYDETGAKTVNVICNTDWTVGFLSGGPGWCHSSKVNDQMFSVRVDNYEGEEDRTCVLTVVATSLSNKEDVQYKHVAITQKGKKAETGYFAGTLFNYTGWNIPSFLVTDTSTATSREEGYKNGKKYYYTEPYNKTETDTWPATKWQFEGNNIYLFSEIFLSIDADYITTKGIDGETEITCKNGVPFDFYGETMTITASKTGGNIFKINILSIKEEDNSRHSYTEEFEEIFYFEIISPNSIKFSIDSKTTHSDETYANDYTGFLNWKSTESGLGYGTIIPQSSVSSRTFVSNFEDVLKNIRNRRANRTNMGLN